MARDGYEGIEFSMDSTFVALKYNTLNHISAGYYNLEATNEGENYLLSIIFPAYEFIDVYSIPYDNYTEIRYYDIDNGNVYSASALRGSGMIIKESEPDSIFNQLSGTFEGILINNSDITDSLFISEGYFIFVF